MQEFFKKLIVILKKDGRKMGKYTNNIGIVGINEKFSERECRQKLYGGCRPRQWHEFLTMLQ